MNLWFFFKLAVERFGSTLKLLERWQRWPGGVNLHPATNREESAGLHPARDTGFMFCCFGPCGSSEGGGTCTVKPLWVQRAASISTIFMYAASVTIVAIFVIVHRRNRPRQRPVFIVMWT